MGEIWRNAGEHTTFVIDIPEATLEDLRERLVRTRWPDVIGAGWDYGINR